MITEFEQVISRNQLELFTYITIHNLCFIFFTMICKPLVNQCTVAQYLSDKTQNTVFCSWAPLAPSLAGISPILKNILSFSITSSKIAN